MEIKNQLIELIIKIYNENKNNIFLGFAIAMTLAFATVIYTVITIRTSGG